LQSTNEELETAKEELQSNNEELTTVNDELQTRNNELNRLNNDLVNLLGAVDFPIVMLEADGRIRRFTSAAEKILNLLPSDIGRQIGEIRPGFDEPNLQALVSEVMESMTLKELEVSNREGRNFRLLARPYKTSENKIDGAVISLIDITKLKHHLVESQTALKYATSVADTLPLPLVVLDERLQITSSNRAFGRMFEVDPQKVIGKEIMSFLSKKGWNRPQLREMLSKVLTHNQDIKNLDIELTFRGPDRRIIRLNAQEIRWQDDTPVAILLSLDDITESRTLERALENSLQKEKLALTEARNANKAKDNFLSTLSHELRTPLTAILIWTQVLKRFKNDPEKIENGLITIEASANAQGQLINDLLEISSIQSGKISLSLSNVDIPAVVKKAVESIQLMAKIKNIAIQIHASQDIGLVRGDALRIQQILWNILTNSIKFSYENTTINIHVNNVQLDGSGFVSVRIVDQGISFAPAFLPKMFQRFSQEDSSTTNRAHGGLGICLALVYDLVKSHGGGVKAESPGAGKGATFTVLLPHHDHS
jgi:two-component system CheB/CheR fusion protein